MIVIPVRRNFWSHFSGFLPKFDFFSRPYKKRRTSARDTTQLAPVARVHTAGFHGHGTGGGRGALPPSHIWPRGCVIASTSDKWPWVRTTKKHRWKPPLAISLLLLKGLTCNSVVHFRYLRSFHDSGLNQTFVSYSRRPLLDGFSWPERMEQGVALQMSTPYIVFTGISHWRRCDQNKEEEVMSCKSRMFLLSEGLCTPAVTSRDVQLLHRTHIRVLFSLSLPPTVCPAGYSRAVMALVGLTCAGVLHWYRKDLHAF